MIKRVLCALVVIAFATLAAWAQNANANANAAATPPNSASSANSTNPNDVPRISVMDLKSKLDKNDKVVVVDVRGHVGTIIKGALHIPIGDLEKNLDKLPKDKLIVTVCS